MTYLNTIQKFIKIFRVISLVMLIFCICGAIYSLIGLVINAGYYFIPKLTENKTFEHIAHIFGHGDMNHTFAMLISNLVVFLSDGYLHRCFHHYLDFEIEEGTPFTDKGAHKLRIAGIKTIIVAPCATLTGYLIHSAFDVTFTEYFSLSPSLEFGLALILLSLVIHAGVEVIEIESSEAREIEELKKLNDELLHEIQMGARDLIDGEHDEKIEKKPRNRRFTLRSIFFK